MSGGRKISMTDSVGKALFSVPDGGIIRMLYGNGEDYFAVCRYLDESHAEIDGIRYAVRELHREWNKTKSAMPLLKSGAWITGGLIFLWNRLFYRAVVRSEYRANQPHHGKERRRVCIFPQLQRHLSLPFMEVQGFVGNLCRRGAERA